MKNVLVSTALAAAVILTPLAGTTASAAGLKFAPGTSERTKAKLNKWFRPHVFTGGRFGPRERAALGDPAMSVVDRRRGFGSETYQCSFVTVRGKRGVVCD